MANEDCERCEGKGFYIVPNYQHEVLERIECEPCMFDEHERWHIAEELSKVLVNASIQKLAQIVAELVVNGHAKTNKEYSKLYTIIQTKNIQEALVLGDVYNQ